MFFLRKLIWRFLLVTFLGYVIRKFRASDNPKLQRVAATANRVTGGAFGMDPQDPSLKPKRRVGRNAGSAVVGGAMSYFMDPVHGQERRQRAKEFTSRQVAKVRNGQRPLLPEHTTAVPTPAIATAGPAIPRL